MNTSIPLSQLVDIYQMVTNRIIAMLEKGTVPWKKSWVTSGIPMNLVTKRPYSGINVWLLLTLNYQKNLFITYKQVIELGGNIIRGEHGHLVVFWRIIPNEHPDDTRKPKALLRYFKVFNISQCENLPVKFIAQDPVEAHTVIPICDHILLNMPDCPIIEHRFGQPFYHPIQDYINMPKPRKFKTMESYYATLWHELVHSIGHEKRLNRPSLTEMAPFGSPNYSLEELIAELGAAYLCSVTGIIESEISSSADYISGWLKCLRNDKRFIIQASSHAQKAVDYILNRQENSKDAHKEVE